MNPEEPTVLDYVKSLLTFWKGKPLQIPPLEVPAAPPPVTGEPPPAAVELDLTPAAPQLVPAPPGAPLAEPVSAPRLPRSLPWSALFALGLALVAQISLEPRPYRTWILGLFLYLIAVVCLIWSTWRGGWAPAPLPPAVSRPEDSRVRARWLYISLPLALLAFLTLGGNRFTGLNVFLWALTVLTCTLAFWQGPYPFRRWAAWLREHLRLPWQVSISGWTLLVLAVAGLVLFFRLNQLNAVPSEMVSDHSEKLLDVWDVLNGQPSIFFPRNTGREAMQMYLTAAIIRLFDTGFSHLSLKLGTVLAGLCTLPYIYLLGKELGNRWVGLSAALFAGMAYWPNVISRVGLRFPLYPLFVAPVLYYLIRGLRTANRNDFILAGLALGIGLHGYTPIRILPLLILVAVGLYLLHAQARGKRVQTISHLMVLVLVALMVFLPLLRYALENPEMFGFRAFSRLGTIERPLPGPALVIFIKNLWNALVMFAWSDGNIWVHSVTGRPALDFVSGALYYLGGVLLIVRYLRQRHWQDLLLLLSVPMLMLPSILSLAFPDENPALNRAAGAMVPVFILVGVALEGLLSAIRRSFSGKGGTAIAWGVTLLLVGLSGLHNYDLVFNQYRRAYDLSAWNTTEMGAVVRDFGRLYGSTETAWVVAYPHWVDTRLVGMNAGDTLRDYAIWPDELENTLADPRPKLFLVNPEDQAALDKLWRLYPLGTLTSYVSRVEKNFLMFNVPPSGNLNQAAP
jgi:hypothetical protein